VGGAKVGAFLAAQAQRAASFFGQTLAGAADIAHRLAVARGGLGRVCVRGAWGGRGVEEAAAAAVRVLITGSRLYVVAWTLTNPFPKGRVFSRE
jgi:hypothetical protein